MMQGLRLQCGPLGAEAFGQPQRAALADLGSSSLRSWYTLDAVLCLLKLPLLSIILPGAEEGVLACAGHATRRPRAKGNELCICCRFKADEDESLERPSGRPSRPASKSQPNWRRACCQGSRRVCKRQHDTRPSPRDASRQEYRAASSDSRPQPLERAYSTAQHSTAH